MKKSVKRIVLGNAPLDSDALAYINAVESADGQTLELNIRSAINNFVIGCKSDGTWNAIKSCCILAGAKTLNGALVPLKGIAPTNFNFIAGDYNRKTGLIGNGSNKCLDSNRADDADPLNDCHLSVFASQAGSGALEAYLGVLKTTASFSARLIQLSDGYTGVGVRIGSLYYLLGFSSNFIGGSRSNSGGYTVQINGASNAISGASDTPSSSNLTVFAMNYGGSIVRYSTARIAFYSIGTALDLALLEARVNTLINTIGGSL